MIYVVLLFLTVSLLLYVLLAGADFGAGIIELFSSEKNQAINKKTVYRVMGPVWEANHIWIIILIVILWIGFPNYYNIMVISLHIPLTLTLLGITLRGVAFVFRYYDAYKDNSQILYDWMFKVASLVTPIFLGLTFGGVLAGNIILPSQIAEHSFIEVYVSSWFNGFAFLTAFFFTALCAFLSAIFLIGEVENEVQKVYIKKASTAIFIVVSLGFMTIIFGLYKEIPFAVDFLKNNWSIGAVGLSALLLIPLWRSINKTKYIVARVLAGLQILLILFAAGIAHYPYFLFTKTGSINIFDEEVAPSVINVLGISLLVGGFIILPGLFHLFKSFKLIKVLDEDTL